MKIGYSQDMDAFTIAFDEQGRPVGVTVEHYFQISDRSAIATPLPIMPLSPSPPEQPVDVAELPHVVAEGAYDPLVSVGQWGAMEHPTAFAALLVARRASAKQ
jgi:hypothetical protein